MLSLASLVRAERKRRKMTQKQFGALAGIGQTAVSEIEKGGTTNPHNKSQLASALGITESALEEIIKDSAHASNKTRFPRSVAKSVSALIPTATPYTRAGMTPVMGRGAAGSEDRLVMTDEPVEYVVTPAELEGVEGAYCLYVYGTSMVPRYFPNEIICVHPHRPYSRNDFVVVQVEVSGVIGGFIKQFVCKRDEKIILHQYNPDREIEFNQSDVIATHLIVGSRRA